MKIYLLDIFPIMQLDIIAYDHRSKETLEFVEKNLCQFWFL